jgi:uncharacterized Zn finger protein (UPF0148 family)
VPALAASAAAFPCKRCGQPLEGSRRGGRIYCPTCKGEVDREHNRKTARASAERKAALVRAAAAVVVPPMPAVSRPLEAELTAGVGLEKTLAAFCAELRRAISTIRRAQYLQKILDSAEA